MLLVDVILSTQVGAWIAQWLVHSPPLGSNPGVRMWQGSGRPSKVGGFPRVLRFPPPCMTTERQHSLLRERVYKFFELSV